ncbi:4-hydroxy-tetrahydrodipicolinate reductase [Actinomarinicola tropica]|uniref:4-hydroxy-tetrahydrodipicolinate reductase n=1 Tax=Actinomarinicola tropica TaxID=2789776 RepID=A0A5Q2RNW8_9ACTN|nr:4-hydroxy-tetrahydrodipicolinate reductase [Actinomarinicola tropica]QGG94895.1 4-hydroxy-tetrahydrodipicolinate reductase [Actinomarinicola tropica]
MSERIRVGVFGAGGRMGATVCDAVLGDPELELVAAVDPHHAGLDLRSVAHLDGVDLVLGSGPDELVRTGAQVAIDFTRIEAARENVGFCADNGIHAVVGTSGFSDEDCEGFRGRFTRSNCVIVPNFAIGAVLMMRFAEIAAPFFETAEIIELHHDQKIDAPSGTAMSTVSRMAAASDQWGADPTQNEVVPGARGARSGGINVHSVRLRGMVAHQEVLLGTTGQSLSIRHDSYDRSSFMPGVLLATKRIADHPGLTVGLDAILGI